MHKLLLSILAVILVFLALNHYYKVNEHYRYSTGALTPFERAGMVSLGPPLASVLINQHDDADVAFPYSQ